MCGAEANESRRSIPETGCRLHCVRQGCLFSHLSAPASTHADVQSSRISDWSAICFPISAVSDCRWRSREQKTGGSAGCRCSKESDRLLSCLSEGSSDGVE